MGVLWRHTPRPLRRRATLILTLTSPRDTGRVISQENVEELIRWAYAWFNREREPPPTWLPDGEFVNAREDPDHATYR